MGERRDRDKHYSDEAAKDTNRNDGAGVYNPPRGRSTDPDANADRKAYDNTWGQIRRNK